MYVAIRIVDTTIRTIVCSYWIICFIDFSGNCVWPHSKLVPKWWNVSGRFKQCYSRWLLCLSLCTWLGGSSLWERRRWMCEQPLYEWRNLYSWSKFLSVFLWSWIPWRELRIWWEKTNLQLYANIKFSLVSCCFMKSK